MARMEAAAQLLRDPAVAYRGRLGPLYRLMVVNLLLTIATLGIYRFWARTRLRRFLWSNTRLGGEVFEYTGTGGELLRGFLRAVLVVLPIGLLAGLGQLFLPDDGVPLLTGALYLLFGFLALVGSFAAQRYQLRRTTWRGIRFGIAGSPFNYGGEMAWRWLLAPFTLFLMLPWIAAARIRLTLGQARFGSARFSFSGEGGALFPWMILAVGVFWLVLLPGLAAAGGIIWAALRLLLNPDAGGLPDTAMGFAILSGLAALAAMLAFAFAIAGSVYRAATLRFTYENIRLDAMRFGFTPSVARTALFLVGNALLTLLSLGLLLPLALHLRMRFLAAAVTVQGAIDLAQVAQGDPGERYGEGLADALGLDAGPI